MLDGLQPVRRGDTVVSLEYRSLKKAVQAKLRSTASAHQTLCRLKMIFVINHPKGEFFRR